MSCWYYCKNGKQEGPITLDELKQRIASGDLSDSLQVWKIGDSEWVRIRKHPELAMSAPLRASSADGLASHKALLKRIQAVIRSNT